MADGNGNGLHVVPIVTITITLNPATGQLSIAGIPDNIVLAYGMLEMARQLVAAQQQPATVPSPLTLLPPGARLR